MTARSHTFAFRLDDYRSRLLQEQALRSGLSPGECARRAVTSALQGPSEAERLYELLAARLTQLERKLRNLEPPRTSDSGYSAAREAGFAAERERHARAQREWLALEAEGPRLLRLADEEPA